MDSGNSDPTAKTLRKGKNRIERQRADHLLVERGMAENRSQARALVLAGQVLGRDDHRIDKPGELLDATSPLRLKGGGLQYVSRGGLKLAHALKHFACSVADEVCLDVGASTGGFTDCLLQAGAASVVALDVGYGQLHWSLRQDPRVVVLERCNIRYATTEHIPKVCGAMVFDVSFISLTQVLPAALRFARVGCQLIALVKPQFEVGREGVGKGGIVRDAALRKEALARVQAAMAKLGIDTQASCQSPIVGAKGNIEYLVYGVFRGPISSELPDAIPGAEASELEDGKI